MNSRFLRTIASLLFSSVLLAACDGARPFDPLATREPIGVAAARAVTQPEAPSNASASASSTSQIDLAWQDNSSGETSFEVHRSTTGATGTFSLSATLGANTTSHSDRALSPGVQYCYRVRNVRSTGKKTAYSAYSNTVCATTFPLPPPPPPPPPAAPAAPSLTNATPSSSSSALVEWLDNSSNEDGFRVYGSTDGGIVWTLTGSAGRNALSVDVGPFQSEQPVCVRLIAFNAGGDSPPSNHVCTTPPAAPSGVSLTPVNDSVLELTWADNSAVETAYEVRFLFRVTSDGANCGGDPDSSVCTWAEYPVAVLPANSTRYSPTDLVNAWEAHRFIIYAVSDGGFSSGADAVWVEP